MRSQDLMPLRCGYGKGWKKSVGLNIKSNEEVPQLVEEDSYTYYKNVTEEMDWPCD